jgi:hypothetical protein
VPLPDTRDGTLERLLKLLRAEGVHRFQEGDFVIEFVPHWPAPFAQPTAAPGVLEPEALASLSTDELERLARRRADEELDIFPDG